MNKLTRIQTFTPAQHQHRMVIRTTVEVIGRGDTPEQAHAGALDEAFAVGQNLEYEILVDEYVDQYDIKATS